MITQTLSYQDDEDELEAYIAFEESDRPKPLVLIAHDWSGRRQFACDADERIAALGYVGFALDMYGKDVFGADGDVTLNTSLMTPFTEDRLRLRKRMLAALHVARNLPQVNPQKVAAIGYCFGGMCVLELARCGAEVAMVISIHGILSPGVTVNEPISAKVLCLHGHDDPIVPPAQVLAFEEEMNAAGVDWQMHIFGRTFHAFTNPAANNSKSGACYNSMAEQRSYLAIKNSLEEVFS